MFLYFGLWFIFCFFLEGQKLLRPEFKHNQQAVQRQQGAGSITATSHTR
jgi:hypothetical protein